MKHALHSLLLTAVAIALTARVHAEATPAAARQKTIEASSSVENYGWRRTAAVDGKRKGEAEAFGWSSQLGIATNHTEWIKLDLGASHRINRVDLYPRNDAGQVGEAFPEDFTIQVSADGTNWTAVVTKTGYAKPGDVVQSFSFDSRNARYVKVQGSKLRQTGGQDYLMQLAEIEVYGEEKGATPSVNLALGAKDTPPQIPMPALASAPLAIPEIRLSPRPVQPVILDLAGQWLHKANPSPDFSQGDVTGTAGWTAIEISRPMPSKDQRFGYQRKIAIPADWAGKRIKFRCDSAEGLAEVWVNGQPVGKHDGSWAQFELDATAAVRPGQDNTVSIQVSPSALGALTKDSQGGIRRKLYLLALPTVHLAGLQAETRFDAQYRDANLTLTADVANESGEPVAVTVRWRLQGGPNGETVLAKFAGTKRVEATLPVSAPKQWHPEHPHLYALTVEVVRDGQVIETVQRRIGFRQVEVQGDKLLVNGRPIKLRGAMLTMWHDSAGWGGLTDAQRRKLVGQWLEMNMNTCYPNPTPDEELLDLCDELGLAVICMARQTWTKATTENAPLFVQQAANLVADHRNHPSVLIWTMGNESRWGPAFEAMAATYRKLDPDRPFMLPGSGTPAAHVPIDSKHYPGVQGKGGGARPVIFTEYAHVNAYNLAEFKTDPGVRDAWYQELRNLWDSMYASERTAGAMIFAGTDCVGMAWGLVDGWHRPKPEFWHARKLYAPVRVVTNTVADGKRRVTVENRYDVTNLKDLRIEWTAGNQHGTVSADVPPHGQGDFEIPAAPDLTLTFTNPQGRLVDTIRFAAEKPAAPTAPVVGQPALKQTDTSLTVNVGNIEWVFDAKTGLLTGGRRAGKSILTGGPKLCLNEALADWQPAKVDTRKTDAGVEIVATGAYGKAKGQYTMTVDNTGALAVRYDFACAGDKPVQVREIGLEFDVDRACDTLSWQRRAPWTEYPADHIGRDVGTAPAFRDPAGKADDPKVEPGWPWSQDQTEAGTADFRSTKYDVLWASLSAKDGAKVTVRSNGQQAVRVAVAGKLVRLLVDDFCGTGGEKYLRASQRNQLIPVGGKLTGAVRLELGE